MCLDHDSRPPIAPIAGGALDGTRIELTAADGNRFAAFRARPAQPGGAGVVILPDVRGLHPFYEELALRFAERGIDAIAIDWFGRTARDRGPRRDASTTCPTSWRRPGPGSRRISPRPLPRSRRTGIAARFTLGFCMGGRMSFLAATLGLDLAGVIGFYGTLEGPWRNDAPAPLDRLDDIAAPVLGLFGGADQGITTDADRRPSIGVSASVAWTTAIVTYPDAPHSFFDRKATDFASESATHGRRSWASSRSHAQPEATRPPKRLAPRDASVPDRPVRSSSFAQAAARPRSTGGAV